jgi:hypothetical protein
MPALVVGGSPVREESGLLDEGMGLGMEQQEGAPGADEDGADQPEGGFRDLDRAVATAPRALRRCWASPSRP